MGAAKIAVVVIDTNVVVSALLFGETPGRLVDLWKRGRIKPFMSQETTAELVRVLAYPKFELTEKEINYLLYIFYSGLGPSWERSSSGMAVIFSSSLYC